MCKSMNALFLSFHGQRTRKQLLDKLSRSSNKKEGGYLMYSKNGIPWVRPPTQDRQPLHLPHIRLSLPEAEHRRQIP